MEMFDYNVSVKLQCFAYEDFLFHIHVSIIFNI